MLLLIIATYYSINIFLFSKIIPTYSNIKYCCYLLLYVGINLIVPLLYVGICCYLLELFSHKSSIIKHDLLLVFIDICWNYFFTVVICCYMLLYVAIYWNYFIIAIQTSMANRKMDLNPIRARSLLEDTFLEIEISKSLWFSL